METKEEKFKEAQRKIIHHLFQLGRPARIEELCGLIQASKSETEYHCDVLGKKGWVYNVKVPAGMTIRGEGDVFGYEISSGGRKQVMEDET